MKINMEPLDFAKLMFRAKGKMQRSQGYHGPEERCPNCEVHEKCGNKSDFLMPWDKLPTDKRETMVDFAQAILWELEACESPKT